MVIVNKAVAEVKDMIEDMVRDTRGEYYYSTVLLGCLKHGIVQSL